MKKSIILQVAGAVILTIVFFSSVYTVNETQQVVITQFGKPVGEAITTPGLKFRIPFIQKVNYFEKRFMEWDGDPNQIPTKDKKFIFVDTYARWQITDPLKFYMRLNNERVAHSRLDDILDGETRDFIASHNLEEAVRTSNRVPISSGVVGEAIGDTLQSILVGRERIQQMILASANKQTPDLGVAILDFKIKRINYATEVQEQVFNRMKSERIRIADQFRSEGQGEASRINGEKERELNVIQSVASRRAEEIIGKADAHAASIYTAAYNRSAASRDLYAFLKSMETLERSLDKETQLILSTDSELFRFLKGMK